MTDPRNIAHDKKVQQEKKHHGEPIAPDAEHAPQPGRKPPLATSHEPKSDESHEGNDKKDGQGDNAA